MTNDSSLPVIKINIPDSMLTADEVMAEIKLVRSGKATTVNGELSNAAAKTIASSQNSLPLKGLARGETINADLIVDSILFVVSRTGWTEELKALMSWVFMFGMPTRKHSKIEETK